MTRALALSEVKLVCAQRMSDRRGHFAETYVRRDFAAVGIPQEFVQDNQSRPGHDHRYAIDTSKARRELGWQPRESFESGLERTVRWYLDNRPWWEPLCERVYGGERLGPLQTAR